MRAGKLPGSRYSRLPMTILRAGCRESDGRGPPPFFFYMADNDRRSEEYRGADEIPFGESGCLASG